MTINYDRPITEQEFIELLKQEHSITTTYARASSLIEGVNEAGELAGDVEWGFVINTLTTAGLILCYRNSYQFILDANGKPAAVSISDDAIEPYYQVLFHELIVLDENGKPLSVDALGELAAKHTKLDDFDLSVFGLNQEEELNYYIVRVQTDYGSKQTMDLTLVGAKDELAAKIHALKVNAYNEEDEHLIDSIELDDERAGTWISMYFDDYQMRVYDIKSVDKADIPHISKHFPIFKKGTQADY